MNMSFLNSLMRAISIGVRTHNQAKRRTVAEERLTIANRKERIAIIKGMSASIEKDKMLRDELNKLDNIKGDV